MRFDISRLPKKGKIILNYLTEDCDDYSGCGEDIFDYIIDDYWLDISYREYSNEKFDLQGYFFQVYDKNNRLQKYHSEEFETIDEAFNALIEYSKFCI